MSDGDGRRNKNGEEVVDFDKAIALAGFGRVQYEVLSACALTLLSVGFQNGLPGYIFSAAQCELQLTSSQIGLLNVGFLIGGTSSAFFWGILADLKGRRKILIASLIADFVVTVGSIFVGNFPQFLACRFLNGFFIGAPGSITFSYLAEFHPPKLRAKSVCYSGMFFTFAWLLLPLLARAVLPLNFGLHCLKSWRLFLLLLSVPELICGFWFMRLQDSPKFVMSRGDGRKALEILRKIYAGTGRHKLEEFPVKSLSDRIRIEDQIRQNVVCRSKISRLLKNVYYQIKSLFRPPLLLLTLVMCVIMFCNMFGFFGFGLWLPDLFSRFERFHLENPNRTATVKELSTLNATRNNNDHSNCTVTFEGSAFESTAMIGASALLGNLISGWLAGKLPLNVMPFASMFLGAAGAGSIFWLQSSTQNLIVACVFQSAMVTANMTIGSVAIEVFPTFVNAMAICLIMCAGRIGAICSNVTFGLLMDKHCEIPIFMVAVVVLLGALLCLLVRPEKRKNGPPEKPGEVCDQERF